MLTFTLLVNSALWGCSGVVKVSCILRPQGGKFNTLGVLGCGEGVVYLTSPGRPNDIDLQLGKACYPCSR